MFFDKSPKVSVPLESLLRSVGAGALRLRPEGAAPALVRARLADGYRDAGLLPASSKAFAGLDPAGWERLALLLWAREEIVPHLKVLAGSMSVDAHVAAAFVRPATERSLLTRQVLVMSPARVEELTRAWLAALQVGVEGETPKASALRLAQLDYGALLARVEQAKLSAEERMKYLEELQAAQVVRRGKW